MLEILHEKQEMRSIVETCRFDSQGHHTAGGNALQKRGEGRGKRKPNLKVRRETVTDKAGAVNGSCTCRASILAPGTACLYPSQNASELLGLIYSHIMALFALCLY